MRQKTYWELFMSFFRIGAFTFGGGYAMIPMIEKEIAEKKEWITKDDILDIIAIAESTPGPIAVNAATFVGYKVGGVFGAFLATFGVVLPSFVLISIISLVLQRFENVEVVKAAFWGIRAGVLALIVKAMVSMYHQMPKKVISYAIMAFAFCGILLFHWNTLWIMVACAGCGVISTEAARKWKRGGTKQ